LAGIAPFTARLSNTPRCTSRSGASRRSRYPRGRDAAFNWLQSAGIRADQAPHDTGNNNRNALFRDPDGNLVEIVGKVA
jgi:catechol 2,3-dioxygenase-like lactoylglutathione lyase family enzyme